MNECCSSRSKTRRRRMPAAAEASCATVSALLVLAASRHHDSNCYSAALAFAYVEPFHKLSHAPPSIANVGGTVPEKVIDSVDTRRRPEHAEDDKLQWVKDLGPDSCSRVQSLHQQRSAKARRPFSLLSWNILSQKLYEGQQKHMFPELVGNETTLQSRVIPWVDRLEWMLGTIIDADSDIVCLQECEYESFLSDILPALQSVGYDGTVQGHDDVREIKRRSGKNKRRHAVATLWKRSRFEPCIITDSSGDSYAHMARGRTLTCALQDKSNDDEKRSNKKRRNDRPTLAVVNVHLEGHPNQYNARLCQLQHAMDDLAWRRTRGPDALNGLLVTGDFNCELQSSVCSSYLRIGRVGRKGGLGGVHGTSCLAVPRALLEIEEAATALSPILEWGNVIPNHEIEHVKPHPFRRNSMVSAFPSELGQRNAREHFTYCANRDRPVAGLDQLWYSSFTLKRTALRTMFDTQQMRREILHEGLPARKFRAPSDHLPIGAMFEWNECDPLECSLESSPQTCTESRVRELFVSEDRPPAPIPKPKSPVMAVAELDMLMVTCPFDSEEQEREMENILEYEPDLPSNPKEKPSKEQFAKLSAMKERKKLLLTSASVDIRPTLQRMLRLKKEVDGLC